ncbi:MAG: site-2 protease family protein [Acidobacteriota bacterium]|nr:site-2 protease family protein [Acidobacteriota bacterium]
MKDTVRLGRIAGVRVGVHWSLVVMVVLVAVGLADNRFSYDAPGYGGATYAVAGVLTAVGLLVGVLLHEFGHAVVARWRGLSVDGITLSWMGGVTRIEGDTGSALNELMISGIGPLTSAAVGGLLYVSRVIASHAGGGSLILAALGWLAWINLVLAAFNLLPASPLDGGRVLHSVVWMIGRNRWRATRVAAGIGVLLGGAIVVLGLIVTERTGDLYNGLLVGFIGWWILTSARYELGSGAVQEVLDGVRIADVMRPVGEAPGWITVRAFAEQYASRRPGWVWLLREWSGDYGGVLVGDSLAAVPYPNWDMSRPLDFALPMASSTGAAPDEDALEVMARTANQQVVFVISNGQTLGAVLPHDIEALVRNKGRTLRSRRPAQRPVG